MKLRVIVRWDSILKNPRSSVHCIWPPWKSYEKALDSSKVYFLKLILRLNLCLYARPRRLSIYPPAIIGSTALYLTALCS